MGTFQEVVIDMETTGLEEGFEMFKKGHLESIGYGYSTRGPIKPGKHWSATWVNTQGMGNHGVAYAVPVSREAKQLVRKHTVTRWVEKGLTMRQAQKLYSAPVRYKHELVARVAECVNDEGIIEAFKTFPGVGPDSHNPWYRRWESLVAKPLDGLSWWRRDALIEAVLIITGNSKKERML